MHYNDDPVFISVFTVMQATEVLNKRYAAMEKAELAEKDAETSKAASPTIAKKAGRGPNAFSEQCSAHRKGFRAHLRV